MNDINKIIFIALFNYSIYVSFTSIIILVFLFPVMFLIFDIYLNNKWMALTLEICTIPYKNLKNMIFIIILILIILNILIIFILCLIMNCVGKIIEYKKIKNNQK